MIPSWLATTYALILGLCFGSFLNVCIARWPHELSVMRPRSRCPRCGHEITWFENIPVVSWLALRARCRGCGEPISAIYPLVELAIGLVWMACAWRYGPTLLALRLAVYITILAGVALTDLQSYLIPDGFTITGLAFALVTSLAAAFRGETALFAGPYDALIGACAGAGLIAIIGWLGEAALKKEAMGMGDMTLMAFVGAALGPSRAIATVFVGATVGAVAFLAIVYPYALLTRRRAAHQAELPIGTDAAVPAAELPLVPFGVFLAPAAVIMLFWGHALLRTLFAPG